jgi:hypothetical protein
MIQEQLDQIQIGAMATPGSSVQGGNLVVTALRTSIDVGSRFIQLLRKNTLILKHVLEPLPSSMFGPGQLMTLASTDRTPYYLSLICDESRKNVMFSILCPAHFRTRGPCTIPTPKLILLALLESSHIFLKH